MFGDPIDTPIMSHSEYQGTMGNISHQYDLLKESNELGTNYVQGLMRNLNPSVNPGGSQSLFSALEKIIYNK